MSDEREDLRTGFRVEVYDCEQRKCIHGQSFMVKDHGREGAFQKMIKHADSMAGLYPEACFDVRTRDLYGES